MSLGLIVGTRKGLFVFKKEGGVWVTDLKTFLGVQVPLAFVDLRNGFFYAGLQHGHFGSKLHRSETEGAEWSEIAVPTYPEKPEGVEETLCAVRKIPIPWSLEMMWCMEQGGKDLPGELWCGTLPGGLFRSLDGGMSWELNRPLWDRPERKKWMGGGYDFPGIHSICVDPQNPSRLRVGVSCGGVVRSEDRGETWTAKSSGMRAEYTPPDLAYDPDIQDPHRMVQCPVSPDHLWVQHHNGIFRSVNGGEEWSEITGVEPSSFGFAVAVHPKDPETAWFVPAVKDEIRIPVDGRLVVTRTRDGGSTFEKCFKGLPQVHAFDLVYRHALDIDESGEVLAMGSTTGSLWVSEDQGDSWTAINHHLPPVYSVRFF